MWMVYRKESPYWEGFAVESERDAIRYCKTHEDFDYVWIYVDNEMEDY